jgi:WD40 repeat protein
MAPEQAQARHDDVGPTADVYAMGVILYELLAGCAPYEGASDVEVLRQSIEGHLKYPRHIRADIPRDLEAICLKAMERTPARRYRTAIDFADDLRRFLDGKPTLARPLNWAGRSVKWLRRNDQIVALAVVTIVAVVLLAVGGWYVRQTQQLKDRQNRVALAELERTQTEQQRDYAGYVRGTFLAWRAGNSRAAAESRDAAARVARMGGELEDFPLRYLAKLIQTERHHFTCPSGPITALAVSADGQRLASGHADGAIALWDLATSQLLESVSAHDCPVSQVAFACGGSCLITVGARQGHPASVGGWSIAPDGDVKPNDNLRKTFPSQVTCIAAAADGTTIYAGSIRGSLHAIHLLDPSQNRSVQIGGRGAIASIVLGNDDRELFVGTGDGKLLQFTTDFTLVHEEAVSRGPIQTIVPERPAGGYTIGSDSNHLMARTALSLRLPIVTGDRVTWLASLPNGGLAANERAGRVLLLLNGHRYSLPTGDVGAVTAGVVTRDGQTLFTGGEDGIIRSWVLGGEPLQRSVRVDVECLAIAVHPDGHRVMASTGASLTDYLGTARETNFSAGGRGFTALRIPAEGPAQGLELLDRSVVMRNPWMVTDEAMARFEVPDGARPLCADLAADGSRLAVGDDRGRVLIWTVNPVERVGIIDSGSRDRIDRVILSNDGKRIAARTRNGISICSVDDPRTLVTIPADDQVVFRFVPDGTRLIGGDRSGVVRVWSADGREEEALYGHVGRIAGIGISPDGRTVVSGGATGEVKFWDLRTGLEIMSFNRHSGPVTMVEFARNGKLLVTGGSGQIGFWETADPPK